MNLKPNPETTEIPILGQDVSLVVNEEACHLNEPLVDRVVQAWSCGL